MDIMNMLGDAPNVSVPQDIPGGDMPGEKTNIAAGQIDQAKIILTKLTGYLNNIIKSRVNSKATISIAGGSGVGKSGIASVLAYILNNSGIGTYVMSGDNYPLRIPAQNDAERLRIYRKGGICALRDKDFLTPEVVEIIRDLQRKNLDSDPSFIDKYSFFETYITGGKEKLSGYLGTPYEQGFDEVNAITESFKKGDPYIYFKRMGREEDALWYEKKDMRSINVLILEWTHAGNDLVKNIDIPILLKSTPEETMQYRLLRGRDKGADSPFTTLVLGIEQQKIDSCAKNAKLILTKSGRLIDYSDCLNKL